MYRVSMVTISLLIQLKLLYQYKMCLQFCFITGIYCYQIDFLFFWLVSDVLYSKLYCTTKVQNEVNTHINSLHLFIIHKFIDLVLKFMYTYLRFSFGILKETKSHFLYLFPFLFPFYNFYSQY